MTHRLALWVAAIGTISALAACTGRGATAEPDFGCPGTSVVDTQASLISPAPGATGVSPSIGTITFSYSVDGIPNFVSLYGGGESVMPIAGTSPTFPANGVASVRIPVLKAGTTYTVGSGNVNIVHLICFHHISAQLGTFTTQ